MFLFKGGEFLEALILWWVSRSHWQNNNFARGLGFLYMKCTKKRDFLHHHCTTTMWKCLISRFVKDFLFLFLNFDTLLSGFRASSWITVWSHLSSLNSDNNLGLNLGSNCPHKHLALVRKILFCHSKIKFISSRHCVISSMYIIYWFKVQNIAVSQTLLRSMKNS